MTDKNVLFLRIAAAVILLASGAWSALYLAQLPINGTIAGMCLIAAALWLLLAWLVLRGHPGRLWGSTPAFILAGFFSGTTLLAPALTTNTSAIAFKDWLGLDNMVFGLLSPVTEELLKFTVVFILCTMVFRIRRPIEAVTIAIAVGLGFSAAENATYIMRAAINDLDSDLTGSLIGVGIRTLPGPWGHSIYTGLAAWGLGTFLCRTDKSIGWRTSRLIGWYALGYGIHAVFNSVAELPGEFAPVIGLLAAVVFKWAGGIWLYLRSRKIGRRDFPGAPPANAEPGKVQAPSRASSEVLTSSHSVSRME